MEWSGQTACWVVFRPGRYGQLMGAPYRALFPWRLRWGTPFPVSRGASPLWKGGRWWGVDMLGGLAQGESLPRGGP